MISLESKKKQNDCVVKYSNYGVTIEETITAEIKHKLIDIYNQINDYAMSNLNLQNKDDISKNLTNKQIKQISNLRKQIVYVFDDIWEDQMISYFENEFNINSQVYYINFINEFIEKIELTLNPEKK